MAELPAIPNWGQHFHGDYYRQSVTLGNGGNVDWPVSISGARVLSIAPDWARGGQPNETEQAMGKTWPAHALVAGDYGNVHGANLGYNTWLWAEAPGVTWKVAPRDWQPSQSATAVTFDLTRYGAFAMGRPEETFERTREVTITIPGVVPPIVSSVIGTTVSGAYPMVGGTLPSDADFALYLTDTHPTDGHQALFVCRIYWDYNKVSAVKVDLSTETASIEYMHDASGWANYQSLAKGAAAEFDDSFSSTDDAPWHGWVDVDSGTCCDDFGRCSDWWYREYHLSAPPQVPNAPHVRVGVGGVYQPFAAYVPNDDPQSGETAASVPYYVDDSMEWAAAFEARRLGVIGFTESGQVDYTEILVTANANNVPTWSSSTTGDVAMKEKGYTGGASLSESVTPDCPYLTYDITTTTIAQQWSFSTTLSCSTECKVVTKAGATLHTESAAFDYQISSTRSQSSEYIDALVGGSERSTTEMMVTFTGMRGGTGTVSYSYDSDIDGDIIPTPVPTNYESGNNDSPRYPNLRASFGLFRWDTQPEGLSGGDISVPALWEWPNVMRYAGEVIEPDLSGQGNLTTGSAWSPRGGVEPAPAMESGEVVARNPITGEIKASTSDSGTSIRTWV